MSYAGHVLDMINRLKQNEALRKSRRNRYAVIKDTYRQQLSWIPQTSVLKSNRSKDEIDAIKIKIRKRFIREERIFWIKSALLIFFLLTGILYFITIYLY